MDSEIKLNSDIKFLGNKREASYLKDNFLFRRFFTGKILGKYEKISNDYYNLFSFNWEDEKISKAKINPRKIFSFKNSPKSNLQRLLVLYIYNIFSFCIK